MPLRVLYVLFRFPQVSQTFVRDEIHGLRSAGVEVDVISLEAGDDQGIEQGWAGPYRQLGRPGVLRGARDHLWFALRHPRRYGRYIGTLAAHREYLRPAVLRVPTEARRILGASAADRVHTHFAWRTTTAVEAFARLLDVPASVTMHAKDIYTPEPSLLRRRIAGFDRLVTVCHYNVGFLAGLKVTGLADPRIAMIPCCVTLPDAVETDRDVDILAVGRLVEKKGFDDLLAAVGALRNEFPGVRVTLVGDGPERQRLETQADRLGIREIVKFTGALGHEQALAQMDAAGLFVLPARPTTDGDSDAMPVVLREAMARKVPVVASRLTGIPESVDAEVGWLICPGSTEDLIQALREALGDPEGRQRRGEAARERVRRLWTPERQAESLIALMRPDASPQPSAGAAGS